MLCTLTVQASNRYAYAWRDRGFVGFDRAACPHCGREVATPLPRSAPYEYEAEGGKKCPDLLPFTGVPTDTFLCSSRVVELFRAAGISGMGETEPAAVFRMRGSTAEPVTDCAYLRVPVIGQVELDLTAMKLKKKNLCPTCGQFSWSRERLNTVPAALHMETWSGHDLCRVGDFPAILVCTDRMAEIIRKEKITGAEIKPIADMFRAY